MLIEGVGDEVVQFVGVLLVLVVAVAAWWSTNARPDRYRTVLVMRSSRAQHPLTVSIRATGAAMELGGGPPPRAPPARVIPLQEMDSIVDADMAMMNNNRLHFYRRIESPNSPLVDSSDESEAGEEPESSEQIREMDSIVSAMEADVTRPTPPPATESNATSTSGTSTTKDDTDGATASGVNATADNMNSESESATGTNSDNGTHKIIVKLKYLNDTLKEVEGSLDELLKDFKWRHFGSELTRACRVRLIFNGRVLQEASTLRACGLHHRAVVHALVLPPPSAAQQQNISTPATPGLVTTHELVAETPAAERAWDLENILMTLVSVALTVVWFFRCEYSNMFTASASVALFGLTVFYSVAIFGLYLSDTFHMTRGATPAQPPAAAAAAGDD